MSDIEYLQQKVTRFRDQRNWKQFHNLKDMALSLTLESTELLEHFQWMKEDEIDGYMKTNKEKVADELSDVLYWVLLFADHAKINLTPAFNRKMRENNKKYPVDKAKDSKKKYTEL